MFIKLTQLDGDLHGDSPRLQVFFYAFKRESMITFIFKTEKLLNEIRRNYLTKVVEIAERISGFWDKIYPLSEHLFDIDHGVEIPVFNKLRRESSEVNERCFYGLVRRQAHADDFLRYFIFD